MVKQDILRQKLELFIRKYYQNKLLKGLIYGLGLGLAYFIVLAVAEYFGHFGMAVRMVLFWLLITGLVAIFGFYIVYPLAKLARLGKRISYDKAAAIIGKYFPEVDDKITNTLQLSSLSAGESDLLAAGIEQKIDKLKPIPFQSAVNFGENKKYWPVLVIPVLVFLVVWISGGSKVFSESSRRLASYNREFLPEAPFTFVLLNDKLEVEQGANIEIRLAFEGAYSPEEAHIRLPGQEARMSKSPEGYFHYTIDNLRSDFSFRFAAAGFQSRAYGVAVLPVPQVGSFVMKVTPPGYTGLKPFHTEVKLVQDIPEGSLVEWSMKLSQANEVIMQTDGKNVAFEERSEGLFALEKEVRQSMEYAVVTRNEQVTKESVSNNRLDVIRDQYPGIEVVFEADSLAPNRLYYFGNIQDDYGFKSLELIVKVGSEKYRTALPFGRGGLATKIGGPINLDSLVGQKGAAAELYIEVGDNDAVNGSKISKSSVYKIDLLGNEEQKEQLDKSYEDYFGKNEEIRQEFAKIERALEAMRKKLMDKKSMSWQEKSKMKELLQKQQQLLEQQRRNEERMEKIREKEEKLDPKEEEIRKAEEKLSALQKNDKDKKLEELIGQIEKLMEELNTQQLMEKMEELQKRSAENRQMQDRMNNLEKDLKFQKDLLEQAKKLEEMSRKQEELAKKAPSEERTAESRKEEQAEQKDLMKEMEEVTQEVERLKEENSAFEKAAEKNKVDEKGENARKSMEQAGESMQKKNDSKANEMQQQAADDMKEMSRSLQQSMMNMQANAMQENIESLRQILENLETLSFGIEDLSLKTRNVNKNDPIFRKLLMDQKRLRDGAKVIEDSLTALGKRVPEIEQIVFDELNDLKANLAKSISELEELQTAQASAHQQYVMTAANNLALLLDESLQNMMQMMAAAKKANANCNKPGSSKPGAKGLAQMQKELGEKMDAFKKGQKEGQGKPGEKEGQSQEIVEMLSRQEQIRKALESMMEEGGNTGDKGNKQKAVEEMKQIEQDLVNGQLRDNYKERLREIETRLLESEKAELEQKQDEERKSRTADETEQLYREELEKYLKEKGIENETLQRLPLNFRSYYKSQTSQYLNTL